jgi:hypothetical protein
LKYQLSISEHSEVWNTHDAESLSQLRPSFRIDFQDDCLCSHFGCHFFHFRRRHPARTTPRRPEIDEDWNARASHNAIEDFRIGIDGFRYGRKLSFACTTPACICKMFGWYPVTLSTRNAFSNHKVALSVANVVKQRSSDRRNRQIM